MCNSTNIVITTLAKTSPLAEETLPDAFIGFLSWLLALGISFLVYGPGTLFFSLYTWFFFLALMPVAVVVGIALHSLMCRRIIYSCLSTVLTVALMFGILFKWLMG